MKLKNIEVGNWVVSKIDDEIGGIVSGEKYKVLKVCGDGTILLDAFEGNGWWVNNEDLKKSKGANNKSELRGVELYRAMAERGDKYVRCFVSSENEATAEFHRNAQCVEWELIKEDGSRTFYCGFDSEGFGVYWDYVVPINSKGEVLTQEEAGL